MRITRSIGSGLVTATITMTVALASSAPAHAVNIVYFPIPTSSHILVTGACGTDNDQVEMVGLDISVYNFSFLGWSGSVGNATISADFPYMFDDGTTLKEFTLTEADVSDCVPTTDLNPGAASCKAQLSVLDELWARIAVWESVGTPVQGLQRAYEVHLNHLAKKGCAPS